MSIEHRYLDIISGESHTALASFARAVLAVAELPYRGLMTMRNSRYNRDASRAHDLHRPTISVGNITAGGTGKTPVVQWLARKLIDMGHRPAILMRGYRKSASGASDEQAMLQSSLAIPVEANPDRIAGAAAVLSREPDIACFLLDDGFQHRRARRSFDLVLINAVQPFGYGHVHPRGLLRESLDGLRRANAILITHACERPANEVLEIQDAIRHHSSAPIFHCDHVNLELLSTDGEVRHELSDLALMPFFLFAGIGQPQSLDVSLKRFASYRGCQLFGDHHDYTQDDLAGLCETASRAQARVLVTTEKDWAKISPIWGQMVGKRHQVEDVLRLQLTVRFWENEEAALLHLITSAMSRKATK